MHRRKLLAALSTFGAAFMTSAPRAAATTAEAPPASLPASRLKVVYHLTEPDRAAFVLGNIKNHVEGVGGPEQVTIALVVHGPALRAFHAISATADISRQIRHFAEAGMELAACGNTMKAQKITLSDLLPGFVSADSGGVVRIAQLQSQGYLYIRP